MSSTSLEDFRLLIVASDGFEHSELYEPYDQLREAGAVVEIAAPESGTLRSWQDGDWADEVEADLSIAEADPADYDALILPGGVVSADRLRLDEDLLDLVRAFAYAAKPIAAIGHAVWLLIDTGLTEGLTLVGHEAVLNDLRNAGATVPDRAVAQDRGIVTARQRDDVHDFIEAIGDALGL